MIICDSLTSSCTQRPVEQPAERLDSAVALEHDLPVPPEQPLLGTAAVPATTADAQGRIAEQQLVPVSAARLVLGFASRRRHLHSMPYVAREHSRYRCWIVSGTVSRWRGSHRLVCVLLLLERLGAVHELRADRVPVDSGLHAAEAAADLELCHVPDARYSLCERGSSDIARRTSSTKEFLEPFHPLRGCLIVWGPSLALRLSVLAVLLLLVLSQSNQATSVPRIEQAHDCTTESSVSLRRAAEE